ncbi:MAG: hypothetical protein QOE84_1717 [Actinomycetota bacterium]|nr:hypothetical protein [Actinomycetota bacterium]
MLLSSYSDVTVSRQRTTLDSGRCGAQALPVTVLPMSPRTEWFADVRTGDGAGERALRVSWHLDRGCVVLSTWRDGGCVATTRLSPDDAARLIGVLADGLAAAAEPATIKTVTTG